MKTKKHEGWNSEYCTKERCRSTHIGDVLLLDGEAYVCVPVGWAKVDGQDQKVVRG